MVCRTGPQGFHLLGHRQASCGSSRTTCIRVQGHEKPVCSGHDSSRREAECGAEGLGGSGPGSRMDEGSRKITEASDSRAVSKQPGVVQMEVTEAGQAGGAESEAYKTVTANKEASFLE